MLKIILMTSLFFASLSYAADEKIYTEKDFNKKVRSEVRKKVDQIKKKSLAELTKEVLAKEEELNEKLRKIEEREKQLKLSEQSLTSKVSGLEEKQARILGCIDKNKNNQLMRINQLVEVISNMKPQKAAELLSVQEIPISVKILEKIDPTKASKIFNLMDKEVSARLQKNYLNMQQ